MMNFTKTLVVFYFYPRPPRGGRPVQRRWLLPSIPISIHALREEGDLRCRWPGLCTAVFLSTPSARRATISCIALDAFAMDFYPRPPRGGRQGDALFRQNLDQILFGRGAAVISIHALREEGDFCLRRGICLPRPISIHALREEGDGQPSGERHGEFFISIHALREEGDCRQ